MRLRIMVVMLVCVACADAHEGGTDASAGSSGSAAIGGVGGSGGTGGAGGTGAVAAIHECATDADCRLAGGCCDCVSIPTDAVGPDECPALCPQSRCTTLGVSAQCMLGRCVFDATCDQRSVTCERLPPVCPAGQQPIVRNNCYGECIDVRECKSVTDPGACADDQAFVVYDVASNSSGAYCFDLEPACNGTPTCECMGNDICNGILCSDVDNNGNPRGGILCFCLGC